jgi:hypothetical protein
MTLIVHVVEPTVRSVFGHHFVYCERIKEYLWVRGIKSLCYFAREGSADPQLRARMPHDKFVFAFRFGRAIALNFAGAIAEDDPPKRRAISGAKQALSEREPEPSIEAENLTWRMRYDLDAVASTYGLSQVEEIVIEEATRDIRGFAQSLSVNFGDCNNVIFLPTGEFFLLRALRATLPALAPLVSQVHIRLWNFQSLERTGADLVEEGAAVVAAGHSLGVSVHLYSEVEWGCERLTGLTGLPAGYLDINSFSDFHNLVADDIPSGAAGYSGREGPLRIFFPGSYRRFPDKGLAFLRDIFLMKTFPAVVEIVLQEPDFRALHMDLHQVTANSQIVILPHILEEAEYRREFAIADAVCLPYDDVTWPDQYRGSGVIMEAFFSAKPVFVHSKTPLTRYSERFFISIFENIGDFWSLVAGFDRSKQSERAASNRSAYSQLLKHNDFFAQLPADADTNPPLRFLGGGPEPVCRSGIPNRCRSNSGKQPPDRKIRSRRSLDLVTGGS